MSFRDLSQVYMSQYQKLQDLENRGESTAYLRIRLMDRHIGDLEQQITELDAKRAEANRQKDEMEHHVDQKYEELRLLAGRIRELDDKVDFLEGKLAESTQEKEPIAAQLRAMTDRALDAEHQIEKCFKAVRTHEDTHVKFIDQIDKLMADTQALLKEIVKQHKTTSELCQERGRLLMNKKKLQETIVELTHEVELFKDNAKDRDKQMEYKCEEVKCLLTSLDEAQARILDWQTRALKGDEATMELTQLRRRVEGLLPELEQVCSSNVQLEKHMACLKGSLNEAQYEAECLREKVFTVSCECQELDTKYVILLKQLDKLKAEIIDLQTENQRLKGTNVTKAAASGVPIKK